MAQYSKQKVDYLNDGRSIFEVVMIADQFGTLVGPSNPSGMAVDAFGRARSSSHESSSPVRNGLSKNPA